VNILAFFLIAFTVVALAVNVGFNICSVNGLKKEMKEAIEKFDNKISKLESDLKEQVENFKKDKNNILKELMDFSMKQATICLKNNYNMRPEHFSWLSSYYNSLTESESGIDDNSTDLDLLNDFMKRYYDNDLFSAAVFLESFQRYKNYYAKKNKPIRFEKIEKTWKELCRIFNGEDEVQKAIDELSAFWQKWRPKQQTKDKT
jgi:hypothetical protein